MLDKNWLKIWAQFCALFYRSLQCLILTTGLSIQKREWIDSPTAKLTGNPLFCDGMQSLMVMTWCVRKCLHFQKEMMWRVFLNTWRCGSTVRGVKGWESGCLGPYRFKVIISDTKEKRSIKNKYEMSLLNHRLLSTSQSCISGSPKPPAVSLWILSARRPWQELYF